MELIQHHPFENQVHPCVLITLYTVFEYIANHGKSAYFKVFYVSILYTPLYKFFVKKNNVQDTLLYNELAKTHYKGKWSHTSNLLYNKKNLIGRLYQYFHNYFETCPLPTAESLFLLVLSMLAMESAHSIRFLYRHFLSGIAEK